MSPGSEGLWRLIRGTFVYGLGSVLNRVVTFLLLPVLTRFLSPAEYGISAILDVLCAFLVAVFSLGFGSSLTICYFESEDRARREMTVSSAFVGLLASVAVLAVAGLAFSSRIGVWTLGEEGRADLVLLAMGTTAMMVLPIPFGLRLQYEERAGRQVTLNLVSTILIVVLSLVGVVVLGRGVRGLWEGRLAAHFLTFVLFASQFPVLRLLRTRLRILRELVRLGIPMIPAFASLFVLIQGNRYILSLFASMDTVGVYSVGVQLGTVMGLAVSAFSTAWTPYFMRFRDRRSEAARTFSRVGWFYVLGFGALSLLFYALARPAILVLTAPAYHAAYTVTGYAATTWFMIGAFNVLLPPCTFAKEIKYSSLVQGVAAVLAVAYNLILIPPLGMTGAGIALMLGTATMALLLYAWNRRRGEKYLQVAYPWRRIATFALFHLVLGTALVLERDWSLGIEAAVSATACFLVAMVAWSLLGAAERRTALDSVRRFSGNPLGFLRAGTRPADENHHG